MSDGLDMFGEGEDIVELNINDKGEVLPKKNNKTLLIDADTIVFSAVVNCEIIEELLPESFYSKEQWKEYIEDPTYDAESGTIRFVFDDDVDNYIKNKLQTMLEMTGCKDYELHFTDNLRQSFRYKIYDMYKANRKKGQPSPAGLHSTKVRWVEDNPTTCFMWDEWEADDIVVSLRRDNPNKYILAAVDKDVLYSLPGRHLNYYTSAKYSIDMKWIEVDKLQAMRHHYIQTLTGDGSDNIPGLNGIGPKKAEKILDGCKDERCMWEAVVEAYEEHGKSVIDAIEVMRLVHMGQLFKNKNGDYELELWKPTTTYYKY